MRKDEPQWFFYSITIRTNMHAAHKWKYMRNHLGKHICKELSRERVKKAPLDVLKIMKWRQNGPLQKESERAN